MLDHVSATLRGILGMLAGRDYRASKDGDARTSSPAEAIDTWRALADEAKVAAAALDPQTELEGPMGAGPALQSLAVPTHDLTVHAWDLAANAGRSVELPDELRIDLDQLVHATPPEILRSPGLFGPEIEAPHAAGPTEQLMAFLGRRRVS